MLHSNENSCASNDPHCKVRKDDFLKAQSQAELRIFDVSCISRKEAKGQVVRKFPEEERQMPHALEENDKGESKNLRKEQARTPREWRLYMGRKASKEGSCIEMILISLEEKASSYTIRLNFHAFEESMDYEALLAGLVTSIGLATIKPKFLNQEVSVGIKTKPLLETKSMSPGRNITRKAIVRKPSSSWEDHSGSN
ncbi:hypothetical protein Tco_0382776 [Tanacetum coccineum]